MKMIRLIVVLMALTLLAGCPFTKPNIVTQTDVCSGWRVIKVDGQDVLTDSTAKKVLAHNCQGAALKCWPYPPAGKSVCEAN